MHKKYRYMSYSNFDETTGISTVTINTELGQFTATAHCSMEDMPSASRFFGCQLAEMRATMKYINMKKSKAKAAYAAIDELLSKLKMDTVYAMKTVSNTLDKYRKEVQMCEAIKDKLQQNIVDLIKSRAEEEKTFKKRLDKMKKSN